MIMSQDIDAGSIYIVWDEGDHHYKFSMDQKMMAVIAFGSMMVAEMNRLGLSDDIHIIEDPDPGIFPASIIAVTTTKEVLTMGFNLSLDDWDQYGPGYRTMVKESVEVMKAAYLKIDHAPSQLEGLDA